MKPIEELYIYEEISVRTFNICRDNNLFDTEQIIDFFTKKYSFFELRNCGRKTNEELIAIVEKYRKEKENSEISPLNTENSLENFETVFEKLSKLQLEILQNFLNYFIEKTDKRTQNVFKNDFDNENRLSKLLFTKNFKNIPNAGAKTISELQIIKDKIEKIINEIKDLDDENIKIYFNQSYLKSIFPNDDLISKISPINQILALDYFFRNTSIYNEYEIEIINSNLKVYDSEKKSLAETAIKLNLSRERVRQIRNNIIDSLSKRIQFIKNIFDDFFLAKNYSLNYLILSDKNKESINEKFETNFAKPVLTLLFFINNPDFSIIGNLNDTLIESELEKREVHKWRNIYLLKKNLLKEVAIEKLIDIVFKKINSKISQREEINLEEFILVESINRISLLQFLKKIIKEEFEIEIENNNVIIERNTRKNVFEYSLEALKSIGKPSSVSEIFVKVKELYPEFDISESGIRASMKRQNGFVPISRTGCFGLKEWEETMEFKGGTLREITREYLDNFDEPKTIDNILEFIQKYRQTNRNSLNSNLKLDESDTFIFFEKSYVGIRSKLYNDKYKELNNDEIIRKTWEESFDNLKLHIELNSCLPQYNSDDENEVILYRWLNIQKQNYWKNALEKERFQKVYNLIQDISPDFFDLNTNKQLNELLNYTIENEKLPDETNELFKLYIQLEDKYNRFLIENNELKYLRKIKEIVHKG